MKKIVMLMAMLLLFACSEKKDAMPQEEATEAKPATEMATAMNKVCPVSGEDIDASDYVLAKYNDKEYALCCNKCKEKFDADPASFIAKMEVDDDAEGHEKDEDADKKEGEDADEAEQKN